MSTIYTTKVKIINCSSKYYWYKNRIGEEFDVIATENTNLFKVMKENKTIDAKDCTILVNKNYTFISDSCVGESCVICGAQATHKVGEEIPYDDPIPNRHNLTAYVCEKHFNKLFRSYDEEPSEHPKKALMDALQQVIDCPYTIDSASVPKNSDMLLPQVVGVISMSNKRREEIIEVYRKEECEEMMKSMQEEEIKAWKEDKTVLAIVSGKVSKGEYQDILVVIEESDHTFDYKIVSEPKGNYQSDEELKVLGGMWVNQTTNGGYTGDEFAGTISIELPNKEYFQFSYSM